MPRTCPSTRFRRLISAFFSSFVRGLTGFLLVFSKLSHPFFIYLYYTPLSYIKQQKQLRLYYFSIPIRNIKKQPYTCKKVLRHIHNLNERRRLTRSMSRHLKIF